jgi:cullin 3
MPLTPYSTAYKLVLYKHGQLLYDRVMGTITNYHKSVLQSKILPLIPSSNSRDALTGEPSRGTDFLVQLKEAWEEHTLCLQMIRDVLMYLDRTFVKHSKFPDVYQMGQTLFRDLILLQDPVRDFLVASLLQQICLERQGDLIDLFLMKKMTDLLSDFDMEPST